MRMATTTMIFPIFEKHSKKTEADYWEYLTCAQASEDFHTMIGSLKNIFSGKWCFEGASKGGEFTTYYLSSHPEDIDLFIAECAMLKLGANSPGSLDYVYTTAGDDRYGKEQAKEYRDLLLRFQVEMIKHRDDLQAGGPGNEQRGILDQYSRDLTQMAYDGRLDPVIGRDDEIRRVIQILSRRTKNNPVLIGEPGVGKTAVVEGLARRIVSGDVPASVRDKRLLTLDLSGMVAGTKYRGEFEERIKRVIEEVTADKNIILFGIPQICRKGRSPRAPLPAGPDRRADTGADR